MPLVGLVLDQSVFVGFGDNVPLRSVRLQTGRRGVGRQLSAVPQLHALQDLSHVLLDRCLADAKRGTDCLVGQAVGDQLQHPRWRAVSSGPGAQPASRASRSSKAAA